MQRPSKYPDQLIGDPDLIEHEFGLTEHNIIGRARLEAVDLRKTEFHKTLARILEFNLLTSFSDVQVEGWENLPQPPYIMAMNHTRARYAMLPILLKVLQERGNLAGIWGKDKYFQIPIVKDFLMAVGVIPVATKKQTTVKMFQQMFGYRFPERKHYSTIRDVRDEKISIEEGRDQHLPPDLEMFLEYLSVVNDYHQEVMKVIGRKTREALFERELFVFIHPEGTRKSKLDVSHDGLVEFALHHHEIPVIPVGCNGAEALYPGLVPWTIPGTVRYRIGERVDLTQFHLPEGSELFSSELRKIYQTEFQQASRAVMLRIHALLDPKYQNPLLYGTA